MSARKYLGRKPLLLSYQQRMLKAISEHKYSIFMYARQTGKSFAVALWAVLRALEKSNHLVAIISPTERQSKELMEKVKRHVEFLKVVGAEYGEKFFEDAKISVLEVKFPNGSRIVGLPANPDGVRGLTGDIVLEEAAFFQDGFKVYQAIFPSITRSKDYKLVVISTPKGKLNLFYHLWTSAENNDLWYREKLTIYDAVAEGLNVDVEVLRKGIPSDEMWRSEYLCEFVDEAEAFIPYELIQFCEAEDVREKDIRKLQGEIFIGVDIGRRHDYTAIAIVEKLGDVLYLRNMEILKQVPFAEQFAILRHLAGYARKMAIDETGIGMQLAEELTRLYGELKIIPVYFTAKAKEEMATRLKTKFQDKLIRIYPDPDLREDLHSVRKIVTDAGNIKLESVSDDGHADRFWALALAVHASAGEERKIFVPPCFVSPRREGLTYGLNQLV